MTPKQNYSSFEETAASGTEYYTELGLTGAIISMKSEHDTLSLL